MKKIWVPLTIAGLCLGAPLTAEIRDQVRNTFEVSPGGTLYLDSSMGSVDIRSGESSVVEIVVIQSIRRGDQRDFEEERAKLDLDIHQSGSDVIVRAEYRDPGRRGNSLNLAFQVLVPYRYNIDARTSGGSFDVDDLEGEVKVETSGGSLALGQISGNVQGRTGGGSITLGGSSGTVNVETSGGSISLGVVEAAVVAHTSGGSISVEEVHGAIDASTSGGSIEVAIASQPESDCRLTTAGGSVSVRLAPGIHVDLDAKTEDNRVISDFGHVDTSSREAEGRLQTRIGRGGPLLQLRTAGGIIRVREY